MSQPATAGIIVGVIFAVPLLLYFSWKGYSRYRRYKQFKGTDPLTDLPPIREPSAVAYTNPMRDGNPNSPGLTPYGTWRDSVSRNSMGGSSIFNLDGASGGMNGSRSRRGSSNLGLISQSGGNIYGSYSNGLMVNNNGSNNGGGGSTSASNNGIDSASTSAPASPLDSTQAIQELPPLNLSIPNDTYDHSRGVSSSSSTMTLKRAYGMNNSSNSSNPTSSPINHPYDSSNPITGRRRESYLPHSPLNRDSIQIIPPTPLGFGFGGLATATDQRTLAFSKNSGVGSNEDWSTGLVWSNPNNGNNYNQNGEIGNELNRPSSAARVAEEQRLRYLLQGPGHGLSANGNGNSQSGGSSRSRSPAQKSNSNSEIDQNSRSESSSIRNKKELERIENTYGGLVKPVPRHPLEDNHNNSNNNTEENLSNSLTSSESRNSSSHGSNNFNSSGNGNGKFKGKLNSNLSSSSSSSSDPSNNNNSNPIHHSIPKHHTLTERNSQIFTSQQSPLQQWGSSNHNHNSNLHSSSPSSPNFKNQNLNRPSSSGTNGTDGSPILSAFRVGGSGGQSSSSGNGVNGLYDSTITNNTSLESNSNSLRDSQDIKLNLETSSPRGKALVMGKDGKMSIKDDLESNSNVSNVEEIPQHKGWGISSLLGR